jgi:hypothetical protein
VNAANVLPVVCLAIVALVLSLGKRRTESGSIPPGHQPAGAVDRPLPIDRRAHLSWLAQVSDDEQIRRESLELIEEDDKFRGRGPRARH